VFLESFTIFKLRFVSYTYSAAFFMVLFPGRVFVDTLDVSTNYLVSPTV